MCADTNCRREGLWHFTDRKTGESWVWCSPHAYPRLRGRWSEKFEVRKA